MARAQSRSLKALIFNLTFSFTILGQLYLKLTLMIIEYDVIISTNSHRNDCRDIQFIGDGQRTRIKSESLRNNQWRPEAFRRQSHFLIKFGGSELRFEKFSFVMYFGCLTTLGGDNILFQICRDYLKNSNRKLLEVAYNNIYLIHYIY